MPTIFSHAVAATAAAQWPRRPLPRTFWAWTIVCAMLPDIDVIGFSFGIQYGDMFGHRGFTHSFFFAAMVGGIAAWRLHRRESDLHLPASDLHQPGEACSHQPESDSHRLPLFLWFTAVTASHGLLDALTDGGRGIAFFAPFSNHRYFFPWRPIQVSPIGAGFFSPRGLRVLASESVWIWLPSAIIAFSARVVKRR